MAVNGIGPVEPGEDTHVREPAPRPVPTGRLAPLGRLPERHRRAALAAATAVALLAGGGYLYATRPQASPVPALPSPAPRVTAPPYPSQVVDIVYLNETVAEDPGAAAGFRFEVVLSVLSGPPVTVTGIAQPYAGLTVDSTPRPPFRTEAGSSRKIVINMRVTECGKVPGNAGLPFLDVTLRNTRAIQTHSFILGARYAQHLSEALQVACSNDSR